jgi:HEAT repeat protein
MTFHYRLALNDRSKLWRSIFIILVAHGLASCDSNNPPDDEKAATERPPVNALLATKADGVSEAVAARVAARERSTLSPPTAAETGRLMQEFETATDERKSEIALILGASAAPEAWSFLLAQVGSGSRAVRMAVLDAIALHKGGDPSPAILTSLSSADAETRSLAATLLGRSAKDPRAWATAAVDPSPDVRVAYHEAIATAPVDVQLHAARTALASSDPQLRREGASVAGTARSKQATDLLIPLLQDPDLADTVAEGLFYFFGRSFDTAAEAQAWWQSNREKFTEDLIAK